jgi:hypothetical protein
MEPTPSTPSTPSTTKPSLPRPYLWGAVIAAAALPVILLGAIIAILAATNHNVLNWME